MSAGLPKTLPIRSLREPLSEGYFPKLESSVAGRAYAARPPNFKLRDINRPLDNVKITISDVEKHLDRIKEAIRNRKVFKTDGTFSELDEKTGIDQLGNILESSFLTPNHDYYGDFHNNMHSLVAYCHDPDHRYLVMLTLRINLPVE